MSTFVAHMLRASCWLGSAGCLGTILLVNHALGHVGLDSPNGGETLMGGSNYTIEWHVEIRHNTLDWDLWYSTESGDGPWEEIAVDLSAGDIDEGAPHTFDWAVPSISIDNAWVRVRQDNAGDDYYDVSESSFSIVSQVDPADFNGDGSVNTEDLNAWQQGFGTAAADRTTGDSNQDGDVDGADYLAWQNQVLPVTSTAQVNTVPEPAATILLVIGLLIMFWQSR